MVKEVQIELIKSTILWLFGEAINLIEHAGGADQLIISLSSDLALFAP
jgi:hypothetical protein